MPSLLVLLICLALAALLVLGFHRAIRLGLAPERLVERRTPGDLGLEYREVRFPTANGRRLFGWFLPARESGPAVALLHGWGANAETLLPLARPLHEAGFSLLLFDARCHGQSDGDRFASLPRFAEDLEHALDWLRQQAGIDPGRVALAGHSVGGAAALLTASRREDVAAVVSIAAFAHPEWMMRRWLAAMRIPYFPLGWYILGHVQRVIGHRYDDIAPVRSIRNVRCPALLIHGAEDATVPVAEARAIHAARAGEHVRLLVLPGSHDDFGDVEKEAEALVAFLKG